MKVKVYHGDDYNTSKLEYNRMNSGNNQEGIGVYFSTNRLAAESYGPNIVSLMIDTKDFLPSRAFISDYVSNGTMYKFLKVCLKVDNKFWYLMTDYGVELSDGSEVEDYHIHELARYMEDEQIRNFQVTIANQIGVDKFIKIWEEIIKKQGTFEKRSDNETWYAVIYSDNKLIKENITRFFNSEKSAIGWLEE